VPSSENTQHAEGDTASSTTLLNQLASWPLPEKVNQNGERQSPQNDTGAAKPAIRHDYFTVGSTRNDVVAIQGEPTTFNDSYLTYGM
jgi:hypothetical protein